jgi:hypothetical protein
MENELQDCPLCNARNIVITKNGLCPNCKQILTDDNKVDPEEAIAKQVIENNNSHEQQPWDKKPDFKRIFNLIFNVVLIVFGIILLLASPVVLFQNARGYNSTIPDVSSALLLLFLGLIVFNFGLFRFKLSKILKIVFHIIVFLWMAVTFLFLGFIFTFSHMGP